MQVFEHYQQLERYIGWTGADARRMQTLGPVLSPYFDALIDDFYAEIQRHCRAAQVITGGAEQIARLKGTLRGWLAELFTGQYDESYVARRWKVGMRHVDVGLDQLYTNASLSRLRRGLLLALDDAWTGSPAELSDYRDSLNALLDLNLAIIEHAYHTEYERRQATAERLAMVGKIADSVVDELRGPIDAAKEVVRSLRDEPDAPPEIPRVQLDQLDTQVNLAEGVVSALNEFVRLPLESFQAVEIVECLRGAFAADILSDAIRVQWDLPVEKLKVLGDSAQLRTVLSNLIRNAQEAMPNGGLLRLGATPDGDAVYVTVGHVARSCCSKACKCSKKSKAAARPAHAAGHAPRLNLGLTILHDIVSRHRGALTITTEASAGTTAALRLPTFHEPLLQMEDW